MIALVWVLLGLVLLAILLYGVDALANLPIRELKLTGGWLAATFAIGFAILLLVVTRGALLVVAVPLLWPLLAHYRRRPPGAPPPAADGRMSVAEAYAALGLAPGASVAEVREAHRRLMQRVHPDHGGSDWLAARLNEARDILGGD